jgi:hypothetical protein
VGSFDSFVSLANFNPRRVEHRDGILLVQEPGTNGTNIWIFDLADSLMPRPMGIVPVGHGNQIQKIAMGTEGVFYLAIVGGGYTQLGLVVVDLGPEYRLGTAASDAFQCYGVRSSRRPVSLSALELSLHDTFGDSAERVGRVREFCAPVDVDGLDIAESGAYLACHHLRGPSFRERLHRRRLGLPPRSRWQPFEVVVDNELGDAQRLTVLEPEQLCVVSTVERKASRVAPADPSGLLLDHFQCYGVEATGGLPSFDPFEASLVDAFGDAMRRVGEPTRLCATVDVDGQGVINSGSHLACYEVEDLDRRLRRRRTRVLVSNWFGEEQRMTLRRAKTVCVPSDVNLP